MEGAEKRKERLKAMCMGATLSELIGTQNASIPTPQNNLVNPLNQVNSTPMADSSLSLPRFDYYTDPMAAFHGNRRDVNGNHTWRNNVNPGSFHPSPPSFQKPRQQPYRNAISTAANYNQPGSLLPPPPPFQIQEGPRQQHYGNVISTPANHNQPGSLLPPPFQIQAAPRQQPYRSVISTPADHNQPGSLLPPPPPPPRLLPYCEVRDTTSITSHNPSEYGPRRGCAFRTNPSDSKWKSKQECAKSLYSPEMMNDPWRYLKPCPGNILKPFTCLGKAAPDEWIPKANITKKPKVDITLNQSSLSIAEYIAHSFEATKDVKNT